VGFDDRRVIALERAPKAKKRGSVLPRFLKVDEVAFSSAMVISLGKSGGVLARWEEIMHSQA